jgi:hypothetical protein
VLTDATIRRWRSPSWRIGESRRVRAAAAMSAIRAAHLPGLIEGRLPAVSSAAEARWPVTQDFVWTPAGSRSPAYG